MWRHVLCLTWVLGAASPALAAQPTTALVDVSSSGAQATGGVSDAPAVSPDGRYAVFQSTATNLSPQATSGAREVYLRDRRTLRTKLVNDPASSASSPQLSANGRTIAYLSSDAAGSRWFTYDIASGARTPVAGPAAVGGQCLTGILGSISADGSAVAYCSNSDVFLSADGIARKVTQLPNGTALNNYSFDAVVSGDGQWVAFTTQSTNWSSPADTDGYRDVVLWHATDGSFTNVSIGNGGAQPNLHSSAPAVDANGCHVAFYSDATNLVAGDSGTTNKTFLRDRCAGTTEIASVTATGAQAKGSVPPSISADGCRVAFVSTNATGSTPSGAAVLRDVCNGLTQRLDVSDQNDLGNGAAGQPSFSGGTGRYVAFTSASTNLSPTDANGTTKDVFVRDLAKNTPPVAKLTLTQADTTVQADATASNDPDGYVLTATTSFGDGSTTEPGLQSTHAYTRSGTYTVTTTVTDADGVSTSASQPVTVAMPTVVAPPPGTASTTADTPPPPPPVAVLTLDKVSLSRTRFATTGKGKGARLTLRLSAGATVKLTFADRKRVKRKSRYVTGKVVTKALPAGTSTISIGAGLKPGKHRVTVSATAADGSVAKPRTLSFTTTKGK